jgi:phosphohistidine phosphatase
MSKIVYIIRHAKSRHAFPGESDFSRPLNETGLQQVEKMAARLSEIKDRIDMIFCSSALRTKQTAIGLATAWGLDPNKIQFVDELYHASEETITQFISSINNSCNTAIIVAHNPGVTDFVNELSTEFKIDDVPTCGAIGIETIGDNWIDFSDASKRVIFGGYPNQNK